MPPSWALAAKSQKIGNIKAANNLIEPSIAVFKSSGAIGLPELTVIFKQLASSIVFVFVIQLYLLGKIALVSFEIVPAKKLLWPEQLHHSPRFDWYAS